MARQEADLVSEIDKLAASGGGDLVSEIDSLASSSEDTSGPKFGGGFRFGQTLVENATLVPPGRLTAAAEITAAQPSSKAAAIVGEPLDTLGRFLVKYAGKKPSLDEWKNVGQSNPAVGAIFNELMNQRASALKRMQLGPSEDEKALEKMPFFQGMKERAKDRQSFEPEDKPWEYSDESISESLMWFLQAVHADKIETWAKENPRLAAVASAAGAAVPFITGMSAVPGGLTAKALASGVATQAAQVGTGAREEVDLGEAAVNAGLVAITGNLAGKAFPRSAPMQNVGAMAGQSMANIAREKVAGVEEPWDVTLIKHGVGGLVSGALGAGGSKPAPKKPGDVSNYAATRATGEALGQTIKGALEKVGIRTRGDKADKIKQRIDEEMLPREIEVFKTKRAYDSFLDQHAEGDAQKRAVLADSLHRTLETDGQMPVPKVVSDDQFAEGLRLLREYGKAGLGIGEKMHERGFIEEARYRPEVKPQDPGLSKLDDSELVTALAKKIEANPNDDVSDLLSEVKRRVITALEPEATAEGLRTLAGAAKSGRTTAYGTTAVSDAVSVAIDQVGHLIGSRARGPNKPAKAEDLVISTKEFDQGFLDDKPEFKVSREAARRGEYGKLVGGIQYGRERGFYFPQVNAESQVDPTTSAFAAPPKQKGPLAHKLAVGHTKARQKPFEEAVKERALDTSPGAAFRVFQDESGMVRDRMLLDFAKDDGLVLRDDQLPDADLKSKAASDAVALKEQIKEIERGLSRKPPAEQVMLRQQINAMHRQAAELRSLSEGSLYKRAVGKQWGDYENQWIHRDVLAQAKLGPNQRSDFELALREIDGLIKTNLVGLNPNQWIPDWLGNYQNFLVNGVNILPEIVAATKVMRSQRPVDAIDDEFFAQAKNAILGGPLDVNARDLRDTKFLEQRIAEAKEQGRNTTWLYVAKAIAGRAKLGEKIGVGWFKPFKALGALAQGRRSLVDEAQSLAAYRVLRTRGVDDSGPMSMTDSFKYLQGVMDYGTLPRAVQAVAPAFTFIRFSSKVVQGLLTRGLMRQPSMFGMNLPKTVLDSIIEAAPGSKGAQAALLGRGLLRLSAQGAQWIAPLLAGQAVALKALGLSKSEFDDYIESQYDYMPAPALELMKQTSIPVSVRPEGIVSFDAGKWFPSLVAMRYFWLGGGTGGAPWWWNALQKNVLVGAGVQGASRKNFKMKNVGEGVGPGERWWPLVETMTPAIAARAITTYAQQMRLPPAERDMLRAFAQNSAGIPLSLLRNPDFRNAIIKRYVEEGIVGVEERTDGSSNYYVMQPDTIEGMDAQGVLDSIRELPIDGATMMRREFNKMNRKMEGAGLR